MKSHWSVEVYKKFGGMPWLHILIAWGSVPAEAVYMYNRRIREKIAQDRQADTVVDDYVTQDHPSDRALAYAQGRDPPEPRGIHHRPSEPKRLRGIAKLLSKRVARAEQSWVKSGYGLPPPQICREVSCSTGMVEPLPFRRAVV